MLGDLPRSDVTLRFAWTSWSPAMLGCTEMLRSRRMLDHTGTRGASRALRSLARVSGRAPGLFA